MVLTCYINAFTSVLFLYHCSTLLRNFPNFIFFQFVIHIFCFTMRVLLQCIFCFTFWQVIADPSLSLKQRALVTDAARALDKARMMRFDEKSGNFYCTELGRIASHFYIQYSSVETYNEMLRRHMNDSEVIGFDQLCFVLVFICYQL